VSETTEDSTKEIIMELASDLVLTLLQRGVSAGKERGFAVSCAVVDANGRTRGVLRHEDALWTTPELALGKARFASAFRRTTTGAMFKSMQESGSLYAISLAGLSDTNGWFLAEGAGAIHLDDESGTETCVGAVAISGCAPASVDQEIVDDLIEWVRGGAD